MPKAWTLYLSELIGTAVLVAIGVSIVILFFGAGSPMIHVVPDAGVRRLLTGFLFGATGGLIAVSSIGKVSGAHINPIVTLAFCAERAMTWRVAFGYILAQVCGGVIGALSLRVWGPMGASIHFGATLPGPGYGAAGALAGEAATTFALILGIFVFIGHPRLRPFTPLLFPFLYAVMVYLEAPVSGTSTNPARSIGPALVSGVWRDGWVYWIGPLLGSLFAVAVHELTWLRHLEVEIAKLYHFGHDPLGMFRKKRHSRSKRREIGT